MSTKTRETRRGEDARQPCLVLASTSRYRRELLARLQMPFSVAAPSADETPLDGERPRQTALRLAEQKARSVATMHPNSLIIGSDQVADCAGEAIGKPASAADTRALLMRLSGRTVIFHTGIALFDTRDGTCQRDVVDVRSTFRQLGAPEIERYVQREPALDCAGGVKIEALGIALFASVESNDPTALIGLPLIRLLDMLQSAGVRPLA